MQAFKSRYFAVPVAAAFAVAGGLAMAQTQAPAPHATDKAKVEKLVKPAGLSDRTMTKNDMAALPATRNWADIDKNGDNLVTPDEMEAYLKATPGPLAKK